MTRKHTAWAILVLVFLPLALTAAPVVSPATQLMLCSSAPSSGNGVQAALGAVCSLKTAGSSALYKKTGTAATAWTRIDGAGASTGTVTSITAGTGLSASPNPITSSGTLSLNMSGIACSAGQAVNQINSDGTATCSSAGVADGDKGDVVVSSSGATWTIDTAAVTLAKMANLAQATVVGRASGAGTGVPTALSASQIATILSGQFVPATTESLSSSKATSWPGSIDLDTLGTIDWYFPWGSAGSGTASSISGGVNLRGKAGGTGWITRDLKPIQHGSWLPATNNSGTTFTGSNDYYTGSVFSTPTISGFSCSCDDTGTGFQFNLPATTTTRVARVYVMHWNNTITMSARFADTGTAISDTDTVAAANGFAIWTITYKSAAPGDELLVRVQAGARTNSGASSANNMFLGAVQLGSS